MQTPLQLISPQLSISKVRLFVKREDLNHPLIQGNKVHKVRPNIQAAQLQGKTHIFTFGGAFSNHLHATAAAGKAFGIHTVGIVRGMAADFENPTLSACRNFGMQLFKVEKKVFDQWAYRATPLDAEDKIQTIFRQYPNAYYLPMGGSNVLGIQGCKDFGSALWQQIESTKPQGAINICIAAGTGGTTAGVYLVCGKKAKICAFPPMRGGLGKEEILRLVSLVDADFSKKNAQHLEVVSGYDFGRYGQLSDELRAFCLDFEEKTGIRPDPIYTCKMFYSVLDMIEKGIFAEGSTVVMVHSGGMQGWGGFE